FQAEDGIRDLIVTGVQTCALPISRVVEKRRFTRSDRRRISGGRTRAVVVSDDAISTDKVFWSVDRRLTQTPLQHIARDSLSRQRSEERRVGKECRSGMAWDE